MFALIFTLAGFAWTCYQFVEVGLSHFGPQSEVFNLVYLAAVLQLLLVGWMLAVCMKEEEEVAKGPKMVKRYVWMASYAGVTTKDSRFDGRTFVSSKKKGLSPKDIERIERYVVASNSDFQAIALQSICFLSYQSVVEGSVYGLD